MSNAPSGLGIALSFTNFFILLVLFQIPLDEVHTPAKHPATKTAVLISNKAVEYFRNFSEQKSEVLS